MTATGFDGRTRRSPRVLAASRVASAAVADPAIEIDADGRTLRVSNPGRVIFPPTGGTGGVTKLQVVEYYLAVAPGIMRALRERPTTLERWPKGVHPGIVLSTRERGGGDAFFQKRIPRGAPAYVETARIQFPSGRFADEICPTEIAVVGWAAQMGTITFHPWPVRRADVDHPDELRIDLDPQPGTDFPDAVRVAATARELLDELGYAGFPKTSGGRGVHIYVRIQPRWTFTDVRHAAIAFGRELERRRPGEVTTKLVERGARRERVRRLQPERPRPHDRLRLQHPAKAQGAGIGAGDLGRARRGRAGGLHGRDDAGPLRPRSAILTRRSTTSRIRSNRSSSSTRRRVAVTSPTRPTTRRCRASPSACSRAAIGIASDPGQSDPVLSDGTLEEPLGGVQPEDLGLSGLVQTLQTLDALPDGRVVPAGIVRSQDHLVDADDVDQELQ